jgi:hypothetical protein
MQPPADQADARQWRQFLSPQEFSRASGLSLATVHRYLKNGRLPFRQPAGARGRILIPVAALAAAVAGSEQPRPVAPTSESYTLAHPPIGSTRLPGPRPRWTRRRGPPPAQEA